jgi:hypothetical protein
MEKKTAIKVFKNTLVHVSKDMKSVSIEGLMFCIKELEKIEKKQMSDEYMRGYLEGIKQSK